VFQFYPSSDDQVQLITQSAQRAGFGGGLVVDYPNSKKARKMYLCLMVGQQEVPRGLDGEEISVGKGEEGRRREEVSNERRRRKESGEKRGRGKKGKKEVKAKDWVLKKKELYRTRGKEGFVACHLHDTLYILMVILQRSSRFEIHCEKAKSAVLRDCQVLWRLRTRLYIPCMTHDTYSTVSLLSAGLSRQSSDVDHSRWSDWYATSLRYKGKRH